LLQAKTVLNAEETNIHIYNLPKTKLWFKGMHSKRLGKNEQLLLLKDRELFYNLPTILL
jgi:hypothetical protein